jgi:hemerythrin
VGQGCKKSTVYKVVHRVKGARGVPLRSNVHIPQCCSTKRRKFSYHNVYNHFQMIKAARSLSFGVGRSEAELLLFTERSAMKVATRVFEPNVFSLHRLDQEHAEIRRNYQSLEETILLGQGTPGILEAADRLVQLILLHFTHEERFLGKLSLLILQKQRDANAEVIARLFEIEDGLRQEKLAAVFQLLLLVNAWIKGHMQQECEEFDDPFPGKRLRGIPA